MATMPERMATIEADMRTVKAEVSETNEHVKTLVAWMYEERGARRQRAQNSKKMMGIAGLMVSVLSLIGGAVSRVIIQ